MPLTVTPNSVYTFTDTVDPGTSVGVAPYYPQTGSFFVNSTTKSQWVCVDPTFGAQVWQATVAPISTFNPKVRGSSVHGMGTYNYRTGYYAQNGHNIFACMEISWSAHSGVGGLQVSNFPFNAANLNHYSPEGVIALENINFGGAFSGLFIEMDAGKDFARVFGISSAAPRTEIPLPTSGILHCSLQYLID